jgi:hypothetical protein
MRLYRSLILAALLLILDRPACVADVLGSNPFIISGAGCRFPDVAYSSTEQNYLVVWADYNAASRGVFGRRVNDAGAPVGNVFRISEVPQTEALFPAIAYNAQDNEYLVTFDTSTSIYGQRVRASDGALLAGNFAIGSTFGGSRSAVAWSQTSNNYLVAYYVPAGTVDVYARRVGNTGMLLGGEMNLSSDANFSGYPAVAYSSSGNQFLVAWDHEPSNNLGYIRGQRVSAATGATLGGAFNIATGGTENRSAIAYDSVNHRWLVQYNESATAGFSYDQGARLVSSASGVDSGVPIAHTTGFEGDTLFGGDVAFAPGFGGRFFSSFGTDTGMAGQESFMTAAPAGSQINLGTGPFTSLNNAADTRLNRFLTTFEGLSGGVHYIHGRLFESRSVPANRVALFTLNNDAQGWTLTTWRSGGFLNGTASWDGGTGNPAGSFKSGGSGMTNNQDYQTREGSYLTRGISLAGFGRARLEFDLRTARDAPPGASGTGTGNLLEGTPEDKLVVYYSLAGTNGPWTIADTLSENDGELPGAWTHRSIDFSSIAGAVNNANFAVRFAWQFNTVNDTGWLDNILLTGTSLVPGDIDVDGDVDRKDAAEFSRRFGRTGGATWATGDFNGDGRATLTDWGLLQSNLGQHGARSVSLPEPSTLGLLFATLATYLGIRRLRRVICTPAG